MVKKVNLFGFPFSVINEKNFNDIITDIMENKNHNLIVFVNFKNFIYKRKNKKYRAIIDKATLIIPTSRTLVNAINYLYNVNMELYSSFSFIVKLIGILENFKKSIYLLGSDYKGIVRATQNIRVSYPNLTITGKYKGNFSSESEEKIVVEGIKKTGANLLLVGNKVKKGQNWLVKNMFNFSSGIFIYDKETFKIIAGKKSSPDEKKIEKAKEWKKGFIISSICFRIKLFFEKKKILKN